MKFILNPENFEEPYLVYLNECFPGWGDGESYQWGYRQNMDLAAPDIFLIEDEAANIMAGSALTYRYIKFPDGKIYVTGTMTGSWTLPLARGKGCFTEIIRYSGNLITQHNYDFLAAFVTEQNASYRRLKSEGSYLLGTHYVRSEVMTGMVPAIEFEVIKSSEETLSYLYNLRNELSVDCIHYSYDFESFVTQFIQRPNTKVIILKQAQHYFILEETSQTFRMLYATTYDYSIVTELMKWAGASNKNIFFLTTKLDPLYAEDEQFHVIPGFLTLLSNKNKTAINSDALFNDAFFNIQYGDKM